MRPTSNEPISPGPFVTATHPTSPSVTCASLSARSKMRPINSTCFRDASSGTIPPNRPCNSTWLETILERISLPSLRRAIDVSSQDVSMPSMTIERLLEKKDVTGYKLQVEDLK